MIEIREVSLKEFYDDIKIAVRMQCILFFTFYLEALIIRNQYIERLVGHDI